MSEAPAPVPEKTREIDRTGEPVFELRSVSHSYGRNKVIFDVTSSVWPGEVVALVGDNGAGKSTLLKIFAGYQRADIGNPPVHGQGRALQDAGRCAGNRHRGRLPGSRDRRPAEPLAKFLPGQGDRPFGWSARILQAEADAAGGREAITELGLTRIRSAEEPVWTLSGGERQSVAITRAMHFGAKLLLLDEPTAALSVRETRNVLQSIGHAREQGLGVLYIDHNMSHVLPVADRIVLLELGRVVRVIDRGEVSVEELQDLIAGPTQRSRRPMTRRSDYGCRCPSRWWRKPPPALSPDWVGLDLQHGAWDLGTAFRGIQLLDALGMPAMVRVSEQELELMPRLLDHGASGVVIAMASSSSWLRRRYAGRAISPKGVRSFGGQRYGLRGGTAEPSEIRPEVYPMIEDRRGVADIAAIAAVKGIAGLHIGPVDLGLGLGLEREDPRYADALRTSSPPDTPPHPGHDACRPPEQASRWLEWASTSWCSPPTSN